MPSPKMKPRSSTGIRASSTGMNFPFRKTTSTSLLEPEPECIPGPAENACRGHRFERDHGILADRLAVERDTQVADARALGDRRNQRRHRQQLGLEPLALPLGPRPQEATAKTGLQLRSHALPDLDFLHRRAAGVEPCRVAKLEAPVQQLLRFLRAH